MVRKLVLSLVLSRQMVCVVANLKKITVEVPVDDLAMAQELTGTGVTDTVRAALKKLAGIQAQHDFAKLRGKVKFSLTLDELRYDRE